MQPAKTRLPSSWIRTLVGVLFSLVPAQVALAQSAVLPSRARVQAGHATISTGGGQMRIDQSSDHAVIDWQGFSVGRGESVTRHAGNGVRRAEPRLGPRDQRDRRHGRGR